MTRIFVKDFFVNGVSDASGIFYGQNFQHHFKQSKKTNSGFGEVIGDMNCTERNASLINDHDVVDSLVFRDTTNSKPL